MRYKVGDRVEAILGERYNEGVVLNVDKKFRWPYLVELDSGGACCFYEHELSFIILPDIADEEII